MGDKTGKPGRSLMLSPSGKGAAWRPETKARR